MMILKVFILSKVRKKTPIIQRRRKWRISWIIGRVLYDIGKIIKPNQILKVVVDGKREFEVKASLNTDVELKYLLNGGILHTLLREMVKKSLKFFKSI